MKNLPRNILIMLVTGWVSLFGQEPDNGFRLVEMNNAKILFQNGDEGGALGRLENLHQLFPNDPQVAYLLSILKWRVINDINATESLLEMVKKHMQTVVHPKSLTTVQILGLFTPSDINCQLVLSETLERLKELWERDRQEDARNVFTTAEGNYTCANSTEQAVFDYWGIRLFPEQRFKSLSFFRRIRSDQLPPDLATEFRELAPIYRRRLDALQQQFREKSRVDSVLHSESSFAERLAFINFVSPLFPGDREYAIGLEMARIETYVDTTQGRIFTARRLCDSLAAEIRKSGPFKFEKPVFELHNRIEEQEVLLESFARKTRADSLILYCNYDLGMSIYSDLVENAAGDETRLSILYQWLTKIHHIAGDLDRADKYRKKVSNNPLFIRASLMQADTLSRVLDSLKNDTKAAQKHLSGENWTALQADADRILGLNPLPFPARIKARSYLAKSLFERGYLINARMHFEYLLRSRTRCYWDPHPLPLLKQCEVSLAAAGYLLNGYKAAPPPATKVQFTLSGNEDKRISLQKTGRDKTPTGPGGKPPLRLIAPGSIIEASGGQILVIRAQKNPYLRNLTAAAVTLGVLATVFISR